MARTSARPARLGTATALLSLLITFGFALSAPPAAAHGPYSVSADTTAADFTVTATDGTKLLARVLKPTTGTNHPVVMYLHWTGGNRCSDQADVTRAQLAALGFVVVSFNSRGMPSAYDAMNACGGTELAEAKDGLNDNGYDWGPRDKQDISDVITAVAAGCATKCSGGVADANNVATIGFSYGGIRAWLPAYAPVDTRVKAIIPMGDGTPLGDVNAISNQRLDLNGFAPNLQWLDAHMGYKTHADPGLFESQVERSRKRYLPEVNNTGAMTNGSPTLTISGQQGFGPEDVGQAVTVAGALSGGGTLQSTIATYVSATQVTLANSATQTTSNAEVTWTQDLGSVNPAGTISAGSLTTLTVNSNGARFKPGDVGDPITVGGANATDPTHVTTIAGYTNDTTVTLAAAAPAAVTNKRVSWGLRAYLDTRTLLDDDPAVDKASKVTTPTFLVNGFLDGAVDVGNRMAIEAFKKLPAGNPGRYLYLGACGHATPSCNATNSLNLRNYLHRFLDRHLRGDGSVVPGTGACTTTCVFYTVPPKHNWTGSAWEIPHSSAWATPSESSVWPPSTATPVTFYLRNTAGQPGLDETPPGTWSEPDESITNSRMGSPIIPFCLGLTYEPALDEVEVYDSDAFGLDPGGNPWRLVDFEVNLNMKSSTTRLQVYVDLYELKSDGREVRIWNKQAVKPAHARAVAPNTKVTLRFRPGDAAMSIASGSKLRLKVATNYKGYFAQEPYNSTYTILHETPSATSSWFKATFL